MQYNVIGLMSGSSLDGLDITFVHFEETAGNWQYEILETACIPYDGEWKERLTGFQELRARDYLLLHTAYGHWLGERVNEFIEEKNLAYRVQLIASHGHTAFHLPARNTTAQLGDGASLAAVTGIRTITDFRSTDIALGGQGAPVVPIGEKLLFPGYDLFLNIGGIANLSAQTDPIVGFDVCPANRVLNLLAKETDKGFDENGAGAARGRVDEELLKKLNSMEYYTRGFPKSLSNEFGLNEILPVIINASLSMEDALRTYTQHIVDQVSFSIANLKHEMPDRDKLRLLITGGGAHNGFLTESLQKNISVLGVECIIPPGKIIDYKEALVIALMGALRWREDVNVLGSVTGAGRDSINGAVWTA